MILTATTVRELDSDLIDVDPTMGHSLAPLRGIATSQGRIRTQGTDTLLYSGFGYSGVVQALRLHLSLSRFARIQDRVIQLYYAGQLQGANLAKHSASDNEIYEFQGPFTLDSEFGVAIDLQPHLQYPSVNTLYIRRVAMEFLL